ncbi:PREDICTED: atherin-like [Rhinopithecus bieti]|uniref:atherin-like n=1 Tax=Rhinopithecus bieti TaxID=61621 RepID=UPI00083C02E3|nr:PREDICTED: atherin-like [Rhinopithecus bieti]
MESGRDKPDYPEILTWGQPGRHGQWARWTPRTGHSRNFSPPNPRRPGKGGRFRRPGSLCHRIPRAVQGPRSPVGGGEERRPRNFPPRLERRRPGPGLALAGRRRRSWCQSPLRAPAGPPPPPAPPLPPVNGQRWSLNRALNHLNAICAPGPHLLPPTAARSVTPLPTVPARPPDPAANRAAAYSNRRAGAALRMLRRPPLAWPRGPTGVVVPVREVALPRTGRGSGSGRLAWPSRSLQPLLAPGPAGRRRCHGDGRPSGWRSAGSCINRFPSRDSPVSGDRGLCSCARPAGAAARERGGRERVVQSRPRPGLAGPGPA